MTYEEVVQTLQTLCAVPLNNTDTDFTLILPDAFRYADNRCYRELDMLATTVAMATSSAALTAGGFRFTVPTQFIDVMYVNLITGSTSGGDANTRTPLERISPQMMDFCFPTTGTSGTATPSKYAMYGTTAGNAFSSAGAYTVRVAPAATTTYGLEIIGPVRPDIPSEDNPNTILLTRFPDLYVAACMVFLMRYQRDGDLSQSWESQYTSLREGASVEIARQKSESVGWSTQTPSVLANQPRDRAPAG